MGYIFAYLGCYAFGVSYTAFAISGNAQTTDVFKAKFAWDKNETILYNTIISSSAVVGIAVGSFAAGPLIKLGRRKAAIVGNLVAIISSAICMIATVPFLTIGRFFLGVAAGIYNVVFGKMIVENMPEQLAQKFAMCHNASICIGFFVAFIMGGILPDPEDFAANEDDEMWRVIYLVPAMIGLVEIALISFVFRQEPIAFCIMMDREAEGKAHMKRVYRKEDSNAPEALEHLIDEHYSQQRRSTTMDASSTTFKQAVCGEKYRRASWTCFLLNCFNQQSGINAINVYANRLLV